jgi:hypothetical protein
MAKITYQPTPSDNDTTVVDGITFHAYEPADVPDERAALVEKLSHNPWFTAGEVDTARQKDWSAARNPAAEEIKHLEELLHSASK